MCLKDAPYYDEACAAGHWAAASDVLRICLLWCFGGFYTDSDLEIIDHGRLKELVLLSAFANKAILGKEDASNVCGAVIIAPPRHPFLTRMLDLYSGLRFTDTYNDTDCNGTTLLTREATGRDDVLLQPSTVFYGVHFTQVKQMTITERVSMAKESNSICLHHWDFSWEKK